jgi:hypothetical protein
MRMTRRMKIWMSQIELVWAAVVLLGMLVHNPFVGKPPKAWEPLLWTDQPTD